jgi:hypothetical protein
MTVAILGEGLSGPLDDVLAASGLTVVRESSRHVAGRPWELVIDTRPQPRPAAVGPLAGQPTLWVRERHGLVDVGPVFNAPGGRCLGCFRPDPDVANGAASPASPDGPMRSIAAGLAGQQILALLQGGGPALTLGGVMTVRSDPPRVSYRAGAADPGCASCGVPDVGLDKAALQLYCYEDTVACLPRSRPPPARALSLVARGREYYTLPRAKLCEPGPAGRLMPGRGRRAGRPRSDLHLYVLDEDRDAAFYLDPEQHELVAMPGPSGVPAASRFPERYSLILAGDIAAARARLDSRALRYSYIDAGIVLAYLILRCHADPWAMRFEEATDPDGTCARLGLEPGENSIAAVVRVRRGSRGPVTALRATAADLDCVLRRTAARPASATRPAGLAEVLEVAAAAGQGLARLWPGGSAPGYLSSHAVAAAAGSARLGWYDVTGSAGPGDAPQAWLDDTSIGFWPGDQARGRAMLLQGWRLAEALHEHGPTAYQGLLVKASCTTALACAEGSARGLSPVMLTDPPSTWPRSAARLPHRLITGAAFARSPSRQARKRGRP